MKKLRLSLIYSFLILCSFFGGQINKSQQLNAATTTPITLQANYSIDNAWTTGYQVTVTLTNSSSSPTSTWQATFTLPNSESLGSTWNGVFSQTNQNITVKNPTWVGGGVIKPGASTTFGLIVHMPSGGTVGITNLTAAGNGAPAPTPVPIAPTLNPISTSTNSYTVSWNSVANATSYVLQQDVTSSFTNPTIVSQGTALSKSFSNVPNGTYYYRVFASNQTGNSPYSNIQKVVINVQPGPVAAPTLGQINNPSDASQYTISWSSVSNASGYTLQESTDNTFQSASTIFQGTGTSYQVTGRSAGTYYYRVNATASGSTSPWSNIVSTVVSSTPPPATGAIVEGYWESWDSNTSLATIASMQCDVFDISFMTFSSTGNHTFVLTGLDTDLGTMDQFVADVHAAGKKVKLSIGGATYPIQPMLQTTADAAGMAQAVANFVNQHSLDGVDFDIEDYPAANLQITLLQDVRNLLPNSIISYTAKSPASTTHPYDQVIYAAYSYFDYLNIMAYDYGPGYTYEEDIQTLLANGVPAYKIGLGLMPGKDDVGVTTTQSDIQNAANYVVANGLKGIMFWDLNRDHENATGLGPDVATSTAWNTFH